MRQVRTNGCNAETHRAAQAEASPGTLVELSRQRSMTNTVNVERSLVCHPREICYEAVFSQQLIQLSVCVLNRYRDKPLLFRVHSTHNGVRSDLDPHVVATDSAEARHDIAHRQCCTAAAGSADIAHRTHCRHPAGSRQARSGEALHPYAAHSPLKRRACKVLHLIARFTCACPWSYGSMRSSAVRAAGSRPVLAV